MREQHMKGLLAAGTILLLSGGAFAQTNSPATGRTGMTDTQIVQQLERQGYSNVKVTDHDRGHVDVMAMKGGQQQKLAVNPSTGVPDTDKD
jgi:hypothetical protein